MTFKELNLTDRIIKAVAEMGYEEATPIQAQTIPLLLDGRDVIGQSQTGTGKTAAFGIPSIMKVDKASKRTQVLVLCPTRELAIQACEEIRKFGKYVHGIKAAPIYGGQPIDRQIKVLKQGCQIVIGTPGRVMDHLRRRTLRLDALKVLVLDEADEMLNMGFRDDIETIIQDVPEQRQTVLFSATMSKEILGITKRYLTDPEMIKVVHKELTVPAVEQIYFEVPKGRKLDVLCRTIDKYDPRLSIVFCNTKRQVDGLTAELQDRGYLAAGLHGDIKQAQRSRILSSFKNGKTDILVATDVAARGIDVENVDAVINYDIPQDLEYYVHRIGRTGRAGKSGRAFTLAVGRGDLNELREIQRYTKSKMKLEAVPSVDEIAENRIERFKGAVQEVIRQGKLEQYAQIVAELVDEDHTSLDVASALCKMLLEDQLGIKEERRASLPDGMVKLKINSGSENGISAGHIMAAVAGDGKIDGELIGGIKVMAKESTAEIPEELAELVIGNMKNTRIKGKKVRVEIAK